MPKKTTQPDYQDLQRELDSVLAELQRDDLNVDAALAHYQRGLELTKQLENYLRTAQNTVTKLQAKFDNSADV